MSRCLLFAIAALVALPTTAGATSAGGRADLRLSGKTAKVLKRAHVKLHATGGGTATATKAMLPIASSTDATVTFAGSLKFGSGKRSLTLKKMVIDRGAGTLSARVERVDVPFFLVNINEATATDNGGDTTVKPVTLKLSALGASLIASRLKLKLGTGATFATASFTLQSASTRLSLAPAFATAASQAGITLTEQQPALHGSTWQFPIANARGRINVKSPIKHEGGLTLSSATATLTLGNFTLDPAGVLYAEQSPAGRLAFLNVDLAGARSVRRGVQLVVVVRAPLTLTPAAADLLNATFATTAFAAGNTVGTASIIGRR